MHRKPNWGCQINEKYIVMSISPTLGNIRIKLYNKELEQVQKFKYLRISINEQVNPEIEIRSRIEQLSTGNHC